MKGPQGSSATLLNDAVLMQKKLEFTGVISKIAISELFKKVNIQVEIKIEERTEEPTINPGQPNKRKIYKPIATSLSHSTQKTEPLQMHSFLDTIYFDHRVSYQDMRNQFLSFYLMDCSQN